MQDRITARNWVISFGPFRVTKASRSLERDGERIHLGSRAFDVLAFLLEHAGQVVSQRALLEAVWSGTNVEEGSLRFQVTALRKVLGNEESKYIINVPGRGYCFTAAVLREDSEGKVPPSSRTAAGLLNPLPRPLHLVGRADAVAAISDLVRARRIVNVVAPGGMGKTVVAVVAAIQLESAFPDGVCFIELGLIDDGARILDSCAAALGMPQRSTTSIDSILDALRTRHMLLFVDGCEHVIDEIAALLEKIVTATSRVHVLATSREALRIEHERIFNLEPLASPPIDQDLSAAEVMSYPAAQLFMKRAQTTLAADASRETVRPVAEICNKLDGLALAIELAGSQAQVFGFDKLAGILEEQFSLTWPGRRTAPPRHQTLGAMLDWSYRLLTPEQKRVFRLLSVFAGPFDLAAACAVANEDRAGSESAAVIGELVSKSLVSVIQSESRARYRLLDTTKTYARGKLIQSSDLARARRRHALFYLQAVRSLQGDERSGELMNIAGQIEDVRSAVAWAFSQRGEWRQAVDLVVGSIVLWDHLQQFQEGRTWIEKALLLLPQNEDELPTEFVLQQALARMITLTSGYGAEFRSAWSRVHQLAESFQQIDRQLIALFNLWAQQLRQANLTGALEYAELFRQLDQSPESSLWRGIAAWLEGVTYNEFGKYAQAEAPLRRAAAEGRPDALAVQQRLFHLDCRWVAMAGLAINCLLLGDAPQAMGLIEKALDGAQATGQDFSIVIVQNNAAQIYNLIGQAEAAGRTAHAMLERCEERSLGNYTSIARAHACIADLRCGSEGSIERLNTAILKLQNEGNWSFVRYFSTQRLEVLISIKKRGFSVPPLHSVGTETDVDEKFRVEALRINGQLRILEGDVGRAEATFLSALRLAESQSSAFWQLRVANDLARLWLAAGKAVEARSLLEGALAKQVNGLDTHDIVVAQSLLRAME